MKFIAFILLLSFSMAQIFPAIRNFCIKESISMLSSDAEKNTEKSNSDADEFSKKLANFTTDLVHFTPPLILAMKAIDYDSEMLPYPFLDTQCPPPNFG